MPAKRPKQKPAFVVTIGSSRVPGYKLADGRVCIAWREHAGGPRKRLVFRTKTAAELKAREICTALANSQADALALTGADRDGWLHARRLVAPLGLPIASAIERLAALLELAGDITPEQLIREALAARTEREAAGICPPTAAIVAELAGQLADSRRSAIYTGQLRRDLDRFAAAQPDLRAVDEPALREYLRSLRTRRNTPVSARRRDNVRDALVRLFGFARERGWLPEGKRTAAERIERVATGHDVTTYSPAELAHLLEHVSPRWRPWMAIAAFAGLRTSEIFRLEWRHVKFDERVIAVPASIARKIRISRLVPIAENLLAWLAPWRDAHGPLYPLRSDAGRAEASALRRFPASLGALQKLHARELDRLRIATGLPWERNALRHSFGSYRLALIKNPAQVAVEMGNSPAQIREHYHDPKPEAEAARYFALMPPETVDNVIPLPLEFARK